MKEGIKYTGFPSKEEIYACPGIPSMEELNKKPLAVIECFQCIPCNPCESSCPFGAIKIGDNMTNLPTLNPDKCKGCSICMTHCPGLAIFIVDMNFTDKTALVKIPYELYPLPKEGTEVLCLNREGNIVTNGKVHAVKIKESFNKTYIVAVEVQKMFAMEVRNIQV